MCLSQVGRLLFCGCRWFMSVINYFVISSAVSYRIAIVSYFSCQVLFQLTLRYGIFLSLAAARSPVIAFIHFVYNLVNNCLFGSHTTYPYFYNERNKRWSMSHVSRLLKIQMIGETYKVVQQMFVYLSCQFLPAHHHLVYRRQRHLRRVKRWGSILYRSKSLH